MKNIQNKLSILLLLTFVLPTLGMSQNGTANELTFGVHRNHPPISITKTQLQAAQTLTDLNKKYQASWVKEYVSVEVLTTYKGNIQKAISKDLNLSPEQKDIMNAADAGTGIRVQVHYLPENNLKHNDIQEISFTVSVDPENQAEFPGGQQGLEQYLKEKLGNIFSDVNFKQYQLAVVKFTIDEAGLVSNPNLVWEAADSKTDQLLLETIQNMPAWKPAKYANGVTVKQEFVLTAGDMESCIVNLINIHQDSRSR